MNAELRKQRQYRVGSIAPAAPGEGEKGPEGIIAGTAILFDTVTQLEPGVFEKIDPRAADSALLRGDDVRCLFNHDVNYVMARLSAGGLRLWKETDGLHFEAQLDPEISWQRDLWRQVSAGVINQCSFGFDILKERREEVEGGELYIIQDIYLYDVALVTFPAYIDTSAEARSNNRAPMPAAAPGMDPALTYLMAEIAVK